jgi:hypothetical protein
MDDNEASSGDEETDSDSDESLLPKKGDAQNVGLKSHGFHEFQTVDSEDDSFDFEAWHATHVKPKFGGKAPVGELRERLFCDHPSHPYFCKHDGMMSETDGSEDESESEINGQKAGYSSGESSDGDTENSIEDRAALEEQKANLRAKITDIQSQIAEKKARLSNLKTCREALHASVQSELVKLIKLRNTQEEPEEFHSMGLLKLIDNFAEDQKTIKDFVAKYDTANEVEEEYEDVKQIEEVEEVEEDYEDVEEVEGVEGVEERAEEKAESEDAKATEAVEGQLATPEVPGATGTIMLPIVGGKRARGDDDGEMGKFKKIRVEH